MLEQGREDRALPFQKSGKFFITVENALSALGDLARFWRDRMAVKVVAITGSNGKTTTKEMCARVLSRRFQVLRTEGNLNNLIGLPLMLLKLSPDHEVAVLEMGMNQPGEISRLKAIARPQVSTITNIGRAHLEFLGSMEAVVRAKGELWENLMVDDWIAVNRDDPRVAMLAAKAPCQKKTFSLAREADLWGADLSRNSAGGIQFSLHMDGRARQVHLAAFGRHHVYNALAAASLAAALGMDLEEIAAGLQGFQPYAGRGKVLLLGRQVHVLDDSYNANPDSLAATLDAFSEMKEKGRGIVILGDMLELGAASAQAHEEAGRRIGEMGLDHLFVIGKEAHHLAAGAEAAGMARARIHAAGSQGEMLDELGKRVREGDWILVKGSRRMQMEKVIAGLKELLGVGKE